MQNTEKTFLEKLSHEYAKEDNTKGQTIINLLIQQEETKKMHAKIRQALGK